MTKRRRGLTMLELMVAVVMVGIVAIAISCQYVAEQTFRTIINNQVDATHDASLVMHHMTRVLRYAKTSEFYMNSDPDYVSSIRATIDHTATGISLPEFTSDTVVVYGRKSDNTFEYKMGGASPYVISNCITNFPVENSWWNSNTSDLSLQITAQKGARSSLLRTKIHILGGG